MRVISGEARGHTLKAPKGMTTRPMSDKIKGAVFSMLSGLLSNSDRAWGQILDMYAGSGSIGIEALSRGAEWADFVEVNAGVCRVITDNLEHTKLSPLSSITRPARRVRLPIDARQAAGTAAKAANTVIKPIQQSWPKSL